MLMQYAAIFDGSENDTFKIKNIFSEAVLTSYHNLCFRAKIRK